MNRANIANALYAAQAATIAKEAARDTARPADIELVDDALGEYYDYCDELIDAELTPEIRDAFIIANQAIDNINPQAIDIALDMAGIKQHPIIKWLNHTNNIITKRENELNDLRVSRQTIVYRLYDIGFTTEHIALSANVEPDVVKNWITQQES